METFGYATHPAFRVKSGCHRTHGGTSSWFPSPERNARVWSLVGSPIRLRGLLRNRSMENQQVEHGIAIEFLRKDDVRSAHVHDHGSVKIAVGERRQHGTGRKQTQGISRSSADHEIPGRAVHRYRRDRFSRGHPLSPASFSRPLRHFPLHSPPIPPILPHTMIIRVRGRPTATRTAKARKSSLRQPRRDA